MSRIEKIRNHPIFVEQIEALERDECDRKFCGHGMNHLLDVARIGYILSKESFRGELSCIPREIIYAAALLHDIARHMQYAEGIPHNEAGAEIAAKILKDTGFTKEEISIITDAILVHRDYKENEIIGLGTLLYLADKKSRACYACNARLECNWSSDKMNLSLEV